MFFVFNRKKIGSYLVSLGTVLMLFVMSVGISNNNKTLATASNVIYEEKQEKIAKIGINCSKDVENIDSLIDSLSKMKVNATFYIAEDLQKSNQSEVSKIKNNGNKVLATMPTGNNVINCKNLSEEEIISQINKNNSEIYLILDNSEDTAEIIEEVIYSLEQNRYAIKL